MLLRLICILLLTLSAVAEPGIILLYNSKNSTQAAVSAQAKQLLFRLRQANGLNQLNLFISSANWSDARVAARWKQEFALTGQELPALAVIHRQGNRINVDNLIRRYTSAATAVETAFSCLRLQAPNLIKQDRLRTGLSLTSNPGGAQVVVDGQASGITPCQVEIKPGLHQFTLNLDNYQSLSSKVKLELGQMQEQHLDLAPLPAFLRIESKGPVMECSLDGQAPIPTPIMLNVNAGPHRLQARASGHYTVDYDLNVVPELLTSVQITPVPKRLRIALNNLAVQGYTSYTTHTSWHRSSSYSWREYYNVNIDANPLIEHLRTALNQFDLIEQEPNCILSIQINSDANQVQGIATLADGKGQVRQTLESQRDMPFVSFDETASLQKRALEVIEDLINQIMPVLQQFSPQDDKAPADRPAEVKIETGPPPAP